MSASSTAVNLNAAQWGRIVSPFQHSSAPRAFWQLANTLLPYALCWWLMANTITISYWLTLPIAVLAAGFLVRAFIIFHDCGHGSFFSSAAANHATGFVTGLLTFTPYFHWRHAHAEHHRTSGRLDRRGVGDVWTMTLSEYRQASLGRRIAYRLARNPGVLFLLAPVYLFIIRQRFSAISTQAREKRSVHWMNLAVLLMAVAMSAWLGVGDYLLLQVTVTALSGAAGVWLFYVQHQFEETYWERDDEWSYVDAALKGSSYYRLPRVLQWFSGNIGFHHIHHLNPRIPNYHLQRCHESDPVFQRVPPMTLLTSIRAMSAQLWDEQHKQMIGFRRSAGSGSSQPPGC